MPKRLAPPKSGNTTQVARKRSKKPPSKQLAETIALLGDDSKAIAYAKHRYARDMVEIARRHTDKALDTIANIMGDDTARDRDRLQAASLILDRGYGKASRTTVHTMVRDLTGDKLAQEARKILDAKLAPHTPSRRLGGGGTDAGTPAEIKKDGGPDE